MTHLDIEDRDIAEYRRSDDRVFAKWLPILIQIAITLLSLGVIYGKLDGRLGLIEYRLGQVEQKVKTP